MAFRHRQQETFAEQFDCRELRIAGGGVRCEAAVDLAGEQQFRCPLAHDGPENELEGRQLPERVRDESGNQRGRDRMGHTQGDGLSAAADPVLRERHNAPFALVDCREFSLDVAAQCCEARVFPIAVDKNAPKLLLEPLDRAREGRLRYAAPHGRLSEIQRIREVEKVPDLLEFHAIIASDLGPVADRRDETEHHSGCADRLNGDAAARLF